MDTLMEVIGGVLQVALLGLLGLLFTWLRSRMQNEKLSEALDMLEKTAEVTVGELQQTVVEELKTASEDGKLSGDEVLGLGEKTLKLVLSRMSEPALAAMRAAGLDVEGLIKAHVETEVIKLKKA